VLKQLLTCIFLGLLAFATAQQPYSGTDQFTKATIAKLHNVSSVLYRTHKGDTLASAQFDTVNYRLISSQSKREGDHKYQYHADGKLANVWHAQNGNSSHVFYDEKRRKFKEIKTFKTGAQSTEEWPNEDVQVTTTVLAGGNQSIWKRQQVHNDPHIQQESWSVCISAQGDTTLSTYEINNETITHHSYKHDMHTYYLFKNGIRYPSYSTTQGDTTWVTQYDDEMRVVHEWNTESYGKHLTSYNWDKREFIDTRLYGIDGDEGHTGLLVQNEMVDTLEYRVTDRYESDHEEHSYALEKRYMPHTVRADELFAWSLPDEASRYKSWIWTNKKGKKVGYKLWKRNADGTVKKIVFKNPETGEVHNPYIVKEIKPLGGDDADERYRITDDDLMPVGTPQETPKDPIIEVETELVQASAPDERRVQTKITVARVSRQMPGGIDISSLRMTPDYDVLAEQLRSIEPQLASNFKLSARTIIENKLLSHTITARLFIDAEGKVTRFTLGTIKVPEAKASMTKMTRSMVGKNVADNSLFPTLVVTQNGEETTYKLPPEFVEVRVYFYLYEGWSLPE
jgi:hypothetical protein